eukprot:TRINITY_DN8254_c0_g1_i1.p1 TRINITY_DN8254_c0_g1~~TRINITY_DN8254_c0_g1_i1.p1  ORF type:complete len:470 (-),score=84.12 TRINITY_DN8254_c0_g1_i1:190-1599(-)
MNHSRHPLVLGTLLLSFVALISAIPTPNDVPWGFEEKGYYVLGPLSSDRLDDLMSLDIDVDRINATDEVMAFIYATTTEIEVLQKRGYRPVNVPDPSQEAHQQRLRERYGRKDVNRYHDYNELTNLIRNVSATYPSVCKSFTIGKSVENRELWGMKISDNVESNEAEPEFLYVGNMHGDETVGREVLIRLIEVLCSQYSTSARIKSLVDATDIYIIPSMNPDGFERGRRYNANGVDLNRNFPDQYRPTMGSTPAQPETRAIMDWSKSRHFVLSANMHGGALVANYPFDGTQSGASVLNPTPDNDVFVNVSLIYSTSHETMYRSREFYRGITNGAQWYALFGGMQDWNYVQLGNFQITLELSDFKYPHSSQLMMFWNQNSEALLKYMEAVHNGVKGFVYDTAGNPLSATIRVGGRSQRVFTDPEHGDYYRLLMPGDYTVEASATGFRAESKAVRVVQSAVAVCNFVLERV